MKLGQHQEITQVNICDTDNHNNNKPITLIIITLNIMTYKYE